MDLCTCCAYVVFCCFVCTVETIGTSVGSDTAGSMDGPAVNATFFQPGGIEFVPQLNAWVIADTGNNRLRLHFITNNTVATVRRMPISTWPGVATLAACLLAALLIRALTLEGERAREANCAFFLCARVCVPGRSSLALAACTLVSRT